MKVWSAKQLPPAPLSTQDLGFDTQWDSIVVKPCAKNRVRFCWKNILTLQHTGLRGLNKLQEARTAHALLAAWPLCRTRYQCVMTRSSEPPLRGPKKGLNNLSEPEAARRRILEDSEAWDALCTSSVSPSDWHDPVYWVCEAGVFTTYLTPADLDKEMPFHSIAEEKKRKTYVSLISLTHPRHACYCRDSVILAATPTTSTETRRTDSESCGPGFFVLLQEMPLQPSCRGHPPISQQERQSPLHMRQPKEGLPNVPGCPLRLVHGVYGLRTAPRLRWQHFRDTLLKFGLQPSTLDPAFPE
eukprot:4528027-Amphidinium_carterae.2